MAQTQKETQKTQSQQNYNGVDATKQKGKDKFIGFPPNKRHCLTPLARHKDFNDAHIKDSNRTRREHHETCDNHI